MYEFSKEEKVRYSRHFLLPEVGLEGQRKFQDSSVLVAGAGGLGCPSLLYLAAAGIGKISILDADSVSLSNLQRQVLYATSDVGVAKVDAASRKLMALNPNLNLSVRSQNIDLENVEDLVQSHDVILDATDNFETRYLIHDACVKFSKPLSYAAIHQFEGQSCFFPLKEDDPCLRCLFPAPPMAGAVQNCAEAGVLGVLPGIFGLIQAKDILLYLLGKGNKEALPFVNKLFHWDLLTSEPQSFSIRKRQDCKCCNNPSRKSMVLGREEGRCAANLNESSQMKSNQTATSTAKPDLKIEDFFLNWMQAKVKKDATWTWTLLDVRLPGEIEICSIPGSLHIPLSELPARLNEIQRQHPVVVYCKSGGRSAAACGVLTNSGFLEVENLGGGILAWIAEKDPTQISY